MVSNVGNSVWIMGMVCALGGLIWCVGNGLYGVWYGVVWCVWYGVVGMVWYGVCVMGMVCAHEKSTSLLPSLLPDYPPCQYT